MDNEARPKWAHKIPEDLARWIWQNSIMQIKSEWQFTGEDTSEDWCILTANGSGEERRVPSGFLQMYELDFSPDGHRLIRFKPYAGVEKTISEIDAFEKKFNSERAAYERLKKKFETA